MQTRAVSYVVLLGLGACSSSEPASQEDGLQLSAEALSVHGQFTRDGTRVTYRVTASEAGHSASAHFDIHGIPLDVTVDLLGRSVVEDAAGSTFELADRALMLALRDTLLAQRPHLADTLQGKLLVKAAERYAEVPIGVPMTHHHAFAPEDPVNVTGGCGDDGVTCLPGTLGSSWAIFSNSATCRATPTPYGEGDSECLGRCGIGCSFWDHDYTYDCLDHDVCLTYQSDCSTEFKNAADDWVATFGPYCTSGTSRPAPTPVSVCGNGQLEPGEQCDDRNTVPGDGCSPTCTKEPTPTLRVRAAIDGTSDLVLAGSTLRWHHLKDAAPGSWDNEPTYLNSAPWTPVWPSPGENRDCSCDSQASPAVPALAARDQAVVVTTVAARPFGSVTVKQQPSAANGYTFTLELADPDRGPGSYEFVLSYATP